jgi:predicted nucleotidyltransferase
VDISYDYRDLFKTLNGHKVKYLVIGAYAVAFYTEPRYTKDLDIWAGNDIINAERLYNALVDFGAPLKGISIEDFADKKMIYQIGVAPVRIDILTGISGIKFENAWKNRKRTNYGGIPISIIGIKELIYSKKKIKREQDILDVKKLSNKKFF